MTEAEIEKLVHAWITLHEAEPGNVRTEENPNEWAFESLWLLEFRDPETCWDVILKIMKETSNENVLSALAAGPLEGLLVRHGDKLIDRVETRAIEDKRFCELLDGVWQNAMSDDIWERISAIKNRDSHEH